MPVIQGTIERVGNWIGGRDFVGYIDVLKVGGNAFRKIRCTSDVLDCLREGENVTIVINRIMWMKPEILGVKPQDNRKGWAISFPRFMIMIFVHIPLVLVTVILGPLVLVSLAYSVWSVWRLTGDYKIARQFI